GRVCPHSGPVVPRAGSPLPTQGAPARVLGREEGGGALPAGPAVYTAAGCGAAASRSPLPSPARRPAARRAGDGGSVGPTLEWRLHQSCQNGRDASHGCLKEDQAIGNLSSPAGVLAVGRVTHRP